MIDAAALRPLLWGAVLLAGVAASVYAVRDGGDAHHADEHAEAVEYLVAVPDVAAVELLHAGRLARFDRTGEGHWFLHPDAHSHAPGDARADHAHAVAPESSERIGKALGLFARARIERPVGTAEDRARFGLTFPDLVVAVFAPGKPRAALTLEVGDVAPDGLSRYVLIVERGTVVTIPNYHIANLTGLLKG
ncbi:DUF4340 domain-containing protein [Azospirillum sp.]|uniref:DUF4340 domain-containing protein n=1 Tax=Azospirillum sp. TaxID=34012 RepID=UPI002D67002F|nr:DUF4340 domain-containing protein [Azospirillum sp.]HYD67969.1 DUF4340 domain-containing protein [Azospirillum sp.]